ncbi:MAG TPA: DUF167 domain-containing protein [Methanobacterium sp.]|nr:DUF167 domain-containing protein [Methanobacterium sp.]
MQAINQTEEGVLVDIVVSPKSSRFTISGYDEWREEIEVKIKSVPQKGKANQEIVKEFSRLTSMDVKIVSGLKSRHKTLKIYGITKKDFEEIIDILFD